jgi:protein-S-isoprenylcysteine O-methyltransferase Ste14
VLIPPYCDRRNIWTLDGDPMRYTGLILFFAGSILRLAAAFALGRRFSGLVAIQPDHHLKTDGLCQYIRHPSTKKLAAEQVGMVRRLLVRRLLWDAHSSWGLRNGRKRPIWL